MRCGTRLVLATVAVAAGLLSMMPIAAPAPSSTAPTPPTSTTDGSGCCGGTPDSTPPPSGPSYDPTLTAAPSDPRRGTQVTVSGAGWPCETVQIAPSWSEPIRKTVTDYSFTEPVQVPGAAELGSQTITVTCLVQYFLVSKSTTVTIRAVPVVNSSAPDTSSPETSVPETSVTPTRTALQPPNQRDNHIRDILAIAALLVASGGALLVLRLRRGRPTDPSHGDHPDPRPSPIRVRVAVDPNPAIHVRELDTRSAVPGIRVRLAANEPQLHVREVR